MKQYDLFWAEMPRPIGRRPVLVLTRSAACAYLNRVIVAEITTTIRHIPVEVVLGVDEGLPSACVANMDNLHVVDKKRLTRWIGALRTRRAVEVKRAVGHAFDWVELKDV